jgi:HlyD family secretion protein
MKIKFDKAPVSPQHNHGVAVSYGSAKRTVAQWRWYLLLLMVLALPLFLVAQFFAGFFLQSTPAMVIAEYAVVRAGMSGRIANVAQAGDHVAVGDPLLSLVPPVSTTPTTELAAQTLVASTAGASTSRPLAGADSRENGLRSVVALAQEQASMAQSRLAQIKALQTQQAATQQEVAVAESAMFAAQTALVRAQDDLSEARRQRLKEVAAANVIVPPATPTAAGDTVAPAQGTVDWAVRSPLEGTVMRALVLPQEWVVPGTEVALVQGSEAPTIQAFVPPDDMRYAQTGQTATLRFFDGGRIKATVVGVVSEAGQAPTLRNASLVPREPSILVRLKPNESLPERYRIHQLPLKVRFDRAWFKGGA